MCNKFMRKYFFHKFSIHKLLINSLVTWTDLCVKYKSITQNYFSEENSRTGEIDKVR